ncbi:rho-related GTP-binding protein RhoC-like protein, partial [Aphelenchoides avenae]
KWSPFATPLAKKTSARCDHSRTLTLTSSSCATLSTNLTLLSISPRSGCRRSSTSARRRPSWWLVIRRTFETNTDVRPLLPGRRTAAPRIRWCSRWHKRRRKSARDASPISNSSNVLPRPA